MPYFICPNCKQRSIDIDRKEGLYDEAVACHHCGFGFLFELMDDYYPAPGTGLRRLRPRGAHPRRRPRASSSSPAGTRATCSAPTSCRASGSPASRTSKNPAKLALEWGVRRLGREDRAAHARAADAKPITGDFFPAYDDDGGLLVALTPRATA